MNESALYHQETAGSLMVTNIPRITYDHNVRYVKKVLAENEFDEIDNLYIVAPGTSKKLLGTVPTHKILNADDNDKINKYIQNIITSVGPHADQEKVAVEAIKSDITNVPVINKEGEFLGIVPSIKIMRVLHDEHLEDFLRSSGITGDGANIIKLLKNNVLDVVLARIPWLLVGLSVGLCLGFITSIFEHALKETIALVFFIPVIAYIAGSIGNQSGTILIRSMTVFKINYKTYLLKELSIALVLGVILGVIGGLGALIISQSIVVAQIVGLSLLFAVTFSSVFGCIVPMILKALKKDPAIASGPISTAFQDAISLVIYFLIALALV